ncbi:MAG: hypothetical protein ACREDR_16235 [Blastocatellia bacterium]
MQAPPRKRLGVKALAFESPALFEWMVKLPGWERPGGSLRLETGLKPEGRVIAGGRDFCHLRATTQPVKGTA